MSVNKAKTPTKDGKCWFFRVPYRDEFNTIKQYNSKKYVQAFKNDTLENVYYKIEENEVEQITDKNKLEKFKELYEIKPSNVVYLRFRKEKDILDKLRKLETEYERILFLHQIKMEELIKLLKREELKTEERSNISYDEASNWTGRVGLLYL